MAICPEHGPYDKVCAKCGPAAPQKVAEFPKVEVPVLVDGDKFILRSYELEASQAQLAMRDAQQKFQQASQALSSYAQTVFEKMGIDPKEWILDAKSMTLVKRENLPDHK